MCGITTFLNLRNEKYISCWKVNRGGRWSGDFVHMGTVTPFLFSKIEYHIYDLKKL
jgi:hypothetical protein